MILQSGTQDRVIAETTTSSGVTSREGSVITDSLVATLFVESITSGDLTVEIFTLTDTGREVSLFAFPVISAGTTNLLLKKAGVTMQRFRVVATYSGECKYEVYVRAVNGIGESSVKILGSGSLETSAASVSTTPAVLIPSALVDRNGLSLLNYQGGGILYISEDITKLPAQAWPVAPGGGWSLDINAGVTIYAVSSSGTLDVRIAQSGG